MGRPAALDRIEAALGTLALLSLVPSLVLVAASWHLVDHGVVAALFLAGVVSSWLPVQWAAADDAISEHNADYAVVFATVALLPPAYLVPIIAGSNVVALALTAAFGNGVVRPTFTRLTVVVNVGLGVLPSVAAASSAALSPDIVHPGVVAATVHLAGSACIIGLLTSVADDASWARLWWRNTLAAAPITLASVAAGIPLAAAIGVFGAWPPVVVFIGAAVVAWRQAVLLYHHRGVGSLLLELATDALSVSSVDDVCGLIASYGRRLLGRDVHLHRRGDQVPGLAAADVVATCPVTVDAEWEIAVGQGPLRRPLHAGRRTRLILEGLCAAADVALAAAAKRERTASQATHDELTDLLNRRGFEEAAQRLLARARHDGRLVTLAYVDLDRFKQVNDTLGHDAGDEVLVAVGDALRAHLRPSDVAGRLGGDEFVVVFGDELDEEAATDRLATALSALPHGVGSSIGTVRGDDELDCLLRRADHRMYSAKAGARADTSVQGH